VIASVFAEKCEPTVMQITWLESFTKLVKKTGHKIRMKVTEKINYLCGKRGIDEVHDGIYYVH